MTPDAHVKVLSLQAHAHGVSQEEISALVFPNSLGFFLGWGEDVL